jgi:hypothetical protein
MQMPRNVVSLLPRRLVLPTRTKREAQRAIMAALGERYRARPMDAGKWLAIDFPKRLGRWAAQEQVSAALDEIDPRWRRLFVLYPKEGSLRDRR